MVRRLNCLSLFSGAGIGESYFESIGIDVLVANELLDSRAKLYATTHLHTDVVCGDITQDSVKGRIVSAVGKRKIQMVLASPPCQGFSIAGKNKSGIYKDDSRNYLIFEVIWAIDKFDPSFVLIENVPALLKATLTVDHKELSILDLLTKKYSGRYLIDYAVLNAADYGVPQRRERAIIKLWKSPNSWPWPTKQKQITVYEAIGDLPSLEAGEKSDIKWHFARKHCSRNIEWMRYTPTGHSAFENKTHFPVKPDGTRINGYKSSYRRIRWDAPAPTITIRNDCIASQRNVHPGRLLPDGTYSDARVLTPLELMILDSLPRNWNIPDDTPELLIRQCIGESIPPKMLEAIASTIRYKK